MKRRRRLVEEDMHRSNSYVWSRMKPMIGRGVEEPEGMGQRGMGETRGRDEEDRGTFSRRGKERIPSKGRRIWHALEHDMKAT
jgi:hypothetical protein